MHFEISYTEHKNIHNKDVYYKKRCNKNKKKPHKSRPEYRHLIRQQDCDEHIRNRTCESCLNDRSNYGCHWHFPEFLEDKPYICKEYRKDPYLDRVCVYKDRVLNIEYARKKCTKKSSPR